MAEARRRGDKYVGSEHLLLGLLADPLGLATRAIGVDLPEARAALQRFDGQALDAIGINSSLAVPGASGASGARGAMADNCRRLRLTNGAKQVLQRAAHEGLRLRETRVTIRHILLAILAARPPDQAALLLRFLDRDTDHIRQSLLPVETDNT
jgi:ATP-dependent Clp protease ATP-binding subunit ClpA